jgi:predicted transcriptional regulator of viral defense system
MATAAPNPLWATTLARAEHQWALLRRSDMVALGVHRHQIARWVHQGRLHQVHPGVWTVGHRVLPRRAEFLAAVWWCGGDAALAQESACAWYGWTEEDPDHRPPVHVTTTRDRGSIPGVVVHRTRRLPAADVLTFERLLRVTDAARTLVDRADHLSYPELRLLADQPRSLDLAAVARTHRRLPGRAGWGRTLLLVHSEDARARSELERR